MSREVKAAWIGGICVIIAAIIGMFSFNVNIENDKLKDNSKIIESENEKLKEEINDWENSYNDLKEQFDDLHNENNNLSEEINALKNTIEEYSSSSIDVNNSSLDEEYSLLLSENESLKEKISQLQNELENMKVNSDNPQNNMLFESDTTSDYTEKRVSIFTLDTFKGKPGWYNNSYYSDKDVFTDTYGNEHFTAYVGHHSGRDINYSYNPTYLLDNKYSTCEGEIAWAKNDKNSKETAWIEFYSGDELIYITDKITVDSRPLTFSFSVDGIEKLTIVRNATGSSSSWIIYSYLNLVE